MRIGVDARCGSAKRRWCGRVDRGRLCGMLATLLALLASLVANPPLRAAIVPPETFDCEVEGRTVEVPASRGPAYHGDHPWQVALFREGRFICGGVLLGAEWVLTAGICVARDSPQSLAVGHGAADLSEARTASHAVSEIHLHPEFDGQQGPPRNDIALLRLAVPVARVRNSHANLPRKGEARALERPGTCAVLTGWGAQPTPSRLKAANVRIMNLKECRAAYGKSQVSIGEICTGAPRAAATELGDSGGALMVGGSPNRPRWLVGIVSWGEGYRGMQSAKPDVYTRVSHYAGWIESTMASPRERQPARGQEGRGPLGMEFVWIPEGTFVMGSPEDEYGRDDDEVQHEVRISEGFWMGKYEVTQGEWEAVMGENPSVFDACGSRCPVESVSWADVQEFTQKLNERESGSGSRYRLPSEAEWEYAARAGTTGARYGDLEEIAWSLENSGEETHPVGTKGANAWGLHDMLGNVFEWTGDWYGEYPSASVTDPEGPSTASSRVARGGSWGTDARGVRSAYRADYSPGHRNFNFGFRLVRTE